MSEQAVDAAESKTPAAGIALRDEGLPVVVRSITSSQL
jgi:hypothetical protein